MIGCTGPPAVREVVYFTMLPSMQQGRRDQGHEDWSFSALDFAFEPDPPHTGVHLERTGLMSMRVAYA